MPEAHQLAEAQTHTASTISLRRSGPYFKPLLLHLACCKFSAVLLRGRPVAEQHTHAKYESTGKRNEDLLHCDTIASICHFVWRR